MARRIHLAVPAIAVTLVFAGMPADAGTLGPLDDHEVVVQADPFTLEAPELAPGQIEMTTVSARPSLVTGGQIRAEVRGTDILGDALTVTRNGVDVTAAFSPVSDRPGVVTGVVDGLEEGDNNLVARADGPHGVRTVSLGVTNHPIQGPVISGPHQEPFVCRTAGSGMGLPLDEDCSAPTQVAWYARDVLGQFHRLANPYAPYPLLTATTNAGGQTVPFVVRVESAVINRSITRIAVLDDPHARGPDAPYDVSPAWNERLFYQFGASCGTGYHQGANQETGPLAGFPVLELSNTDGLLLGLADRLGEGYATALSTLTTLGVHCNDLLSAETFMMVKEHIVEGYGRVDHTVTAGGSGGAIQQYMTANNYPGLIDAGTPFTSYSDLVTTFMTVHDCGLLGRVFENDPLRWDPLKIKAVTGLPTPTVCTSWNLSFLSVLDPTTGCDPAVPAHEIYHPETNPDGARCTFQDTQRNIWGIDPETGFARRPLDNAGVQYGLVPLNQGQITVGDFIELNRAVGGYDIDANHTPERTEMDPEVARLAYATGRVTGRGALDEAPMIDMSIPLMDYVPLVDIHDQVRPQEMRARLDNANGNHQSQVIWSGVPYPPGDAVVAADRWLDRLDAAQAANPTMSRADAVAQSRAPLGDECRLGPVGIPDLCADGVLTATSTRQAAGAPLSEDVIKCRRKPVDVADYPDSITVAELEEIKAIFPDGVCDWSRPGVGETARSNTWVSFGGEQLAEQPFTVDYPIVRSAAPDGS